MNPTSVVVPPLAVPAKSVVGTLVLDAGPTPCPIKVDPEANFKFSLPAVTVVKFDVVYAVLAVEPEKDDVVSCIQFVRVIVPVYASVPLPPE